MQTLVEHGCGLDVHQSTVVACLLRVRKDGKMQKQLRTFGTTTRELLGLREWLLAEGCTHVAMESGRFYYIGSIILAPRSLYCGGTAARSRSRR
jgi:transposase